MRNLCVLIVLIVLASCQNKSIIKIDLREEIYLPKHYIVTKTDETINIDGVQDEMAWKETAFTEPFIDIEGKLQPKYKTQVKMLWDDTNLYVFAKLEEPHIWATLKKRDTVIFYNNDFEVFIDPSGDTHNYAEIEVNALNTVWDLNLNRPYRSAGKPKHDWNIKNLKTAVKIHGTLNNPKDIDKFWTVEMAIPLKEIVELNNQNLNLPKNESQWRINFSRVNWDHDFVENRYQRKKENGEYLPEYNWVWSPQNVINMHEPEKWGFIQFTDSKNPNEVIFNRDSELKDRLAMYSLFRAFKYGTLKKYRINGSQKDLEIEAQINNDTKVNAYITHKAKTFTIQATINNKMYSINETGYLND